MTTRANDRREQHLLLVSIGMVLLVAAVTVAFGTWSRSRAITFDGYYDFADAVLTVLALGVARLISRGESERFQYGHWHLEPLLSLMNGLVLAITCAYAFVNGIAGLLTGGAVVDFGAGALFTGVMAAVSLAMAVYIQRASTGLDSEFLRIDARGWMMGAILGAALCVSFVLGALLRGSSAAALAPYVDPVILTLVSLALLPFPVKTLWRAIRDILQIAPPELDLHVRSVASAVAARHGFADYTSHVARVGRLQFIEIGLVVASGSTSKTFDELDAIRSEISVAMGGLEPGYWLTVDFTADKRWI